MDRLGLSEQKIKTLSEATELCRRPDLRMPVVTAMDYVERLASELKISGNTQSKAKKVLEVARTKGITSGKAPLGAAMAAIHIAGELTNDKNAPKDITSLAGIPEATIRRMYDDLVKGVKS